MPQILKHRSLKLLKDVHLFLVLRSLDQDTVFQMLSYQSWVKGDDHHSRLAGNAFHNEGQDAVELLCHKSALQLTFNLVPTMSFSAFQPVIPKPVLIREVIPPQVQAFSGLFISVFSISYVSLFLQLVKLPLNSSTIMWCINRSNQFCIICKFA